MNNGTVNIHSIAGLERLVCHLSSASGRLDEACHVLRCRAEKALADTERRLEEASHRVERAEEILSEAWERYAEEQECEDEDY